MATLVEKLYQEVLASHTNLADADLRLVLAYALADTGDEVGSEFHAWIAKQLKAGQPLITQVDHNEQSEWSWACDVALELLPDGLEQLLPRPSIENAFPGLPSSSMRILDCLWATRDGCEAELLKAFRLWWASRPVDLFDKVGG